MKIAWLINLPLPEVSGLMGEEPYPYGGWLINASRALAMDKNIELSVIFPKKNSNKVGKYCGEMMSYYSFPRIDNLKVEPERTYSHFEEILKDVNPDIVHIYGTEYTHSLLMVNTCKKLQIETIVSVQGLVSKISEHVIANLPFKATYGFTLRNFIFSDNIILTKKRFELKGKNEILTLNKTKHIIGRTFWDRACTYEINPNAKYHFCNETLRDEFYKHSWDYAKCEKHSIFLSQGQDSYKGLHFALDALEIIKKNYPKSKLYIGGTDITKKDTFKSCLIRSYYGKYISKKIEKASLEDSVVFTGPLSEKEMCQRFLSSNVFVCPSTIENSPNSLGEAMLLGVPSVASYVGGIPDMLYHNQEGFLYQSDAAYMLAHYVQKVFSDEENAKNMGAMAKKRASLRHHVDNNNSRLKDIYKEIIGK